MRRLDSFLPYEKYKIKEFLSGERYYIIGRKGTGKTALLKYLECKFSEDVTNLVIPIRFKSDFDLIDKKTIKSAAVNVQDEVIEQGMADKSIKSYIAAWQVYLIYQIFKHENSIKSEFQIFNNESDTYKTIWVLLKLILTLRKKRKRLNTIWFVRKLLIYIRNLIEEEIQSIF